jgi:MFS family permease
MPQELHLLRALRSRNYRLFFGGQLISLTGTWLTQIATSWLVYRLTHSTVMLGIVGFAGQIPAFMLAPFAGVLVDRWNLHRVLVITQTCAMIQSLALAALTLAHVITVPQILALYVMQGIVNAFDIPARQAFLVQMIEHREDLSNAIALNSSMFNAARMIGPSIAGVLIAATSEGICFLIDGISYIGVIIALLAMRIKKHGTHKQHRHVLHELKEGVRYAFGFPPIREVLVLVAIVSLAGVPYTVLMPVFAGDILHGGPKTLGFLMASAGIGALGGGITLAARKSIVGLGRWMAGASVGFGLTLVAFSLSHSILLSAALMCISGFFMIVNFASSNTVLQTIVDDDKRGRVMSLFTMCFMGTMPIGSLLAGELARPTRLGPARTVMLGGFCCIAAALIFARKLPAIRKHVRPILVQRGILPQIATGIAAASESRTPPEA